MPSDNFRRSQARMPLARLGVPTYPRPHTPVIGTFSYEALGTDLAGGISPNFASLAWNAANRAYYVPLYLSYPYLVKKVWWANGSTAGTDSLDCGVYTESGTRLFNSGGTLSAGTSTVQTVDITDYLLRPGRYYMALACSGTTATVLQTAFNAGITRFCGVAIQETAYTLPATFTLASMASAFVPLFGISGRTVP